MADNQIASTGEIAEAEWVSDEEPEDVRSDIVATHDAESKGIEFHVSMRDYTLRDMEELIIEAGARLIVGRHSDSKLSKLIEERAINLISEKADKALASVAADIIDQPLIPKFPFQKPDENPMTMRDFIGLTGREYLTARVDNSGKPTTDRHYSKARIQHLVEDFMTRAFKLEIEKATGAAIREIQAAVTARHNEFLEGEKQRVREALSKVAGGAA